VLRSRGERSVRGSEVNTCNCAVRRQHSWHGVCLMAGHPLMSKSLGSSRRLCLAALVAVAIPQGGAAQDVTPIISPPPNIIVPNYNGVPTGPLGGLEGSAY